MLSLLIIASLLIWLAILLLPWQAWLIRESFDSSLPAENVANQRQNVTVLIPARDEAEHIAQTLQSLSHQHVIKQVFLIDDQSTDGTVDRAQKSGLTNLRIIQGQPLPEGWSGKLWALEQGRREFEQNADSTDWLLLLDADIKLKPSTVAGLLDVAERHQASLASLMAQLRMQSFWEKLLIPSFIYFFKLLYPFALSNQGHAKVAAAAGGCILIKAKTLRDIGGFASLKSALIDDCTLAKKVRAQGEATWIGLTHSAISQREYHTLKEIWDMVARTAYSQLQFSPLILALCTVLMAISYLLPIALIVNNHWLGWVIFTLMLISFIPTIKYYRLPLGWLVGLPVSGVLYLCMTWSSALRYYRGQRSQWKGRIYSTSEKKQR